MADNKKEQKRVTASVSDDMYHMMCYWAKKHNMTINQYLVDAIEMKIAYENKDYPVSTLEQARLNQLIDAQTALSSNVESLEKIIISGFDSLLQLTRGDNYLLDHSEDGDIT